MESKDLRKEPLSARRKLLAKLLEKAPENIRFSGELRGSKDEKIRQTTCPFINLPEKSKGMWGLGITPAVMKRCEWVKAVLIAQVKFTEWTLDNQLRQPVFLGLRTDKEAKDVGRE